jgi:hypothetical protein
MWFQLDRSGFVEYRRLHSRRNMIVWKIKAEGGNLTPERAIQAAADRMAG